MAEEQLEPLHNVVVQFPKRTWRRVQIAALRLDLSASEFIRRAVKERLLEAERAQI